MSDTIQRSIRDLHARQTEAVEQYLQGVLVARGVDPNDRTPGWEDRARVALADVEMEQSVEWFDGYRATITTTFRPRGTT